MEWKWVYESWWHWDFQIDLLWLLWVNLIFNCIINLMIYILGSNLNPSDAWIANTIFYKFFDTRLFGHFCVSGQSSICIFRSAQYICQFTSMVFLSSAVDFFDFTVENLLLGVATESLSKVGFFTGESRSLHQGTGTRCLCGLYAVLHMVWGSLYTIFMFQFTNFKF